MVPFYERFLGRFPDEWVLASASVGQVLASWSGLGYNRRALALRDAARTVAERGWPREAAGLRALPGVGPYTAAAVASFAFGEQVAAVDVNVRRVVERVDGGRLSPAHASARAAELLAPGRAADCNQALMELGATLCTARAPRCGRCPIREGCASAFAGGAADRIARDAAAAPPSRSEPRFEDTNRYVRGRVVRALVKGEELPADMEVDRLERALSGLERDGLIVRTSACVGLA